MSRHVITSFCCLLLISCGHTKQISTSPLVQPILPVPALVKPLNQVQYTVVGTTRNKQVAIRAVTSATNDQQIVTITKEEFDKLLENNQILLTHISNLNKVIQVYESQHSMLP